MCTLDRYQKPRAPQGNHGSVKEEQLADSRKAELVEDEAGMSVEDRSRWR